MRKLLLTVAAIVFGWSSGASAAPIQWTVASGGNGHWYDMVTTGGDGIFGGGPTGTFPRWEDARDHAETQGGYLATFTSQEEWSFFTLHFAGPGLPTGWLGAIQNPSSPTYSEPSGGWEWVTGEPWSFTAWASGEPNDAAPDSYLTGWHSGGPSGTVWADHHSPATGGRPYVIEFDTYSDADGDGISDPTDNCPANSNPDQANLDGDAFGDVCDDDRDGDLVPNQFDAFPDDPNEFADGDSDGIGDNADNCLADPNPGQEDQDGDLIGDVCDPDRDGDGQANAGDNCPIDANPSQEDTDGNGLGDACNSAEDADGDEWADGLDNCPAILNPDQADLDNNGTGNVCEPDFDGDGVLGGVDNCPVDANPGQEDTDGNGLGDACNTAEDTDGDEWADVLDNCPATVNADQVDTDSDTVGDACDNCPINPNLDQQDTTGNGTGDLCNDEDLDGLLDPVETNTGLFVDESDTGTDPLNSDTDGDGLEDGTEILEYGSDPHNPDTDADTVIDGQDNCVLVSNTDQANADMGADDDTNTLRPIDHYGDRCDADINNDGIVNTADFFGHFRPCFGVFTATNPECAASDFDGSGAINTGDFFAYFLPGFGGEPGPGVREYPAYTFTSCGQTGRTGPNQEQCDAAYSGTDLEGAVTVVGGIQEWVVPYSGTYTVVARGAQGGSAIESGGLGAKIGGVFLLASGPNVKLLVGQSGSPSPSFTSSANSAGGGGGSFAVRLPFLANGDVLVVAGGGGGSGVSAGASPAEAQGGEGVIESSGSNGKGSNGSSGGLNGGGGSISLNGGASSGAGIFGNSIPYSSSGWATEAWSLENGGNGALQRTSGADGGFGGGGAGAYGGGGGGGYSGGGAGHFQPPELGGGGGGSYNAGTNQDNASGVNAGPGQVTISLIEPPVQAVQAPATPASLNINALWDRDLDGVLDTDDNCLETPNASQFDADSDGFGNACDADLNNDGAVGLDDVVQMLGSLNTNADPAADLNGDGFVGLDDVAAALGMLGSPPGPGKDPCGGLTTCEVESQ